MHDCVPLKSATAEILAERVVSDVRSCRDAADVKAVAEQSLRVPRELRSRAESTDISADRGDPVLTEIEPRPRADERIDPSVGLLDVVPVAGGSAVGSS